MIHHLLNEMWAAFGLTRHLTPPLSALLNSAMAIIFAALIYLLCRKLISPAIHKIVTTTKIEWDDVLLNDSILRAASMLAFAIALRDLLPEACYLYPWLVNLLGKICEIFVICAVVRLVNRGLSAGYQLMAMDKRVRMQPLKGLLQMLKLIVIVIGVIIAISVLINRNPTVILTSLGASAAVLMLVFKDSILGVVAGVQLSANDMLRKGDWIAVPGTPVNGVVQDVSLTTVKVQNFDNTTLTVPPYDLVSKPFQNWRGMQTSGGRRVMRSVTIDFSTVRFCTPDEIARWQKEPWYPQVKSNSIDSTPVNLTLFRCYMNAFLEAYSHTDRKFLFMVRQLQPTDQGVPLEVYCFVDTTVWKDYEALQADIFDHIYATLPTFGLKLYQSPAATDIRSLQPHPAHLAAPEAPAAPAVAPTQTDIPGASA